MAQRQLIYHIGVETDTKQLIDQVNKAVDALAKLGGSANNQLTNELKQASQAALELGSNLRNATNETTGKLDISAFQNNLQRSGKSLDDYARRLAALGPQGREAFGKVAEAIASAELPLKRSSKLLDSLWITMKNTMRWQISTSVIRTFVGGIQTAYGYAQDLNESLNRIQIVTDKSASSMAQFAKQANEAAKNLSTTTTKYTDASLIYYQQGLDDSAVRGRTDATIKYANVADISAEQASQQLTSIWNNFYDGSKSLEYYIDVMTKLGATTASSSSEISEGMQKFASVAGTVGLSYEYAAAALATITATTRESADIVGTSLRTLFARIQSLKLGETLDDGTDLGKYSEALAKVGVSIKTASGQLKDMDLILDELGSKWKSLARDEQMALAQTVAGVRQYTQLITLMDKWDFFQDNIATARGSEGELERQAEIYAESWEAARDRIKAASEEIYSSLINPQFFIDLDKNFTRVLGGVANFVENIGGVRGVLATVGSLMTTIYGDKMVASLQNLAANIAVVSNAEKERTRNLQAQAARLAGEVSILNYDDQVGQQKLSILNESVRLQGILNQYVDGLSERQKKNLNYEVQQLNMLKEQTKEYSLQAEKAQNTVNARRETILSNSRIRQDWQARLDEYANSHTSINKMRDLGFTYSLPRDNTGKATQGWQLNTADLDETLGRILAQLDELSQKQPAIQMLQTAFNGIGTEAGLTAEEVVRLGVQMNVFSEAEVQSLLEGDNLTNKMRDLAQELENSRIKSRDLSGALQAMGVNRTDIQVYTSQLHELARAFTSGQITGEELKRRIDELEASFKRGNYSALSFTEGIIALAQSLTTASNVSRQVANLADVFTNKNLTGIEQWTQSLMSIGFILPGVVKMTTSLVSGVTALKGAIAAGSATFGIAMGAVIPGIGIVLTLLTSVLSILAKVRQARAEAAQAAREEVYAATAKLQEENRANEELISTMQSALQVYQETRSNKSELDDATQALADAYDIEGDALARLSGKYEDYSRILEKAKDARYQALVDEQASIASSQTEKRNELIDTVGANKAKLTDNYSYVVSGWWDQEYEVYQLLQKKLDEAGISNFGTDPTQQNGTYDYRVNITLDKNADYKDFMKLYDIFVETNKEGYELYGNQAVDSGSLADIDKYIGQLKDIIEALRELDKAARINELKLGKGLINISEDDVHDLATYREWAAQVQNLIESSPEIDSSDYNNVFRELVNDSLNVDLARLKDIHDAVQEIKDALKPDDNFSSFLDTAFQTKDSAILGQLNWGLISNEEEFNQAYEAVEKYNEATRKAAETTTDLAVAKQALKTLSKDKNPDIETYTKLAESNIDWDSYGGFNEFLTQTREKQLEFLSNYILKTRDEVLASGDDVINASLALIDEYSEELSRVTEEEKQKLDQQQRDWKTLKNMVEGFRTSTNKAEFLKNLDFSKVKTDPVDWEKVFGFTPYNFKKNLLKSFDEVKTQVENGLNGATIKLDNIEATPEAIENLQAEIQNQLNDKGIHLAEAIQDTSDLIAGYASNITTVYDAIAKGMSQSVDEAGEKVWSFSADAVAAISSIYPGFSQVGRQLVDGTFQITDEMYQAYFDTSQGIISTEAQSKIAILEQTKQELLTRKEYLEKAKQLVKDKVAQTAGLEGLEEQEKEDLLKGYETAVEISNGNILGDQVNTLMTMNQNYFNFWHEVVGYSETAAQDMAANIQGAAANMETTLSNLANAFYAVMQQRAAFEMGAKPGDPEYQKYSARINPVGGVSTQNQVENALNGFQVLQSLKGDTVEKKEWGDQLTVEELVAQIQADAEKAMADFDSAAEILDLEIDQINVAQQRILASVNAAQNTAKKVNKSGSGGSNSLTDALDLSKDTLDKYHELNRALAYQDYLIKKIDSDIKKAKNPYEIAQLAAEKIDVLNNKIALIKQRTDDAFENIQQDIIKFGLAGFEVEIDPNSFVITNYQEIEKALVQEIESKKIAFNTKYANTTNKGEAEKQEIENLEKQLSLFKSLTSVIEQDVDTYFKGITDITAAEEELRNLNREASKEQLKQLATIAERYYEITRIIRHQQTAIDELNEAINRAFGIKKLDAYETKLKEINKQIKNYEKEYNQAFNYAQLDYNRLILSGVDAKLDPTTNEITNYDEIIGSARRELDEYTQYYNRLVQEVNSSTTTAFEKQAYEGKLKDASTHLQNLEYEYKRIQNLVDQYNDSLDKIEEARQAWRNMWRELEDTKLEEIVTKLNQVLQVKNMEQAARKFSKTIAESLGDALTHGQTAMLLGYQNAQTEASKYSDYVQQYLELKDLAANAKVFEDGEAITNIQAIADQMEDLQGKIIGSGEALLEWIDTVEHLLPDAIDAAAKRFAYFTDQLDHNSSIAGLIGELYELQGVTIRTEAGYNRLQAVTQEKLDAALAKSSMQKEWFDNAKRELAEAEAALARETEGTVAYDILKANRDALLEQFRTSQKAYLESAKEAYQAAQEMYERAMEKAKLDAEKRVTNGTTFDIMQDKYDNYIEEQGRYLDNINELYEVNVWNMKLQEAIDKATTSKHKEVLKNLQEEIDLRRRGQTLSKYDLEILNAKYEMTMKQMALEDAQNNKNQMKLVRDSNGNWNYQYFADEDQVAQAKQDFLEAENNYYNIAKQQVQDTSGEIIRLTAEMYEKIGSLRVEDFDSEEAYWEEVDRIKTYYMDRIQDLERQKNEAIVDMNHAALTSILTFTTEGESSLVDMKGNSIPIIQSFSEETIQLFKDIETETGIILSATDQQMISILTSMGVSAQSIIDAIKAGGIQAIYSMGQQMALDMINTGTTLSEIETDWKNEFAETLGDNGMTGFVKDLEENTDKYIDDMEKNWQDYQEKIKDVADKTDTSLEELDDVLDDVSESTDEVYEAGMNAAEALWEQLDAAQSASQAYAELADSIWEAVQAMEALAAQTAMTVNELSQGIGVGNNVVSLPNNTIKKINADDYDLDWSNLITNAILGGASESAIQQLEDIRSTSSHWKDKTADQIWMANNEVRTNANKLKEQGVTHVDYAYGQFANNDKSWQEWLKLMGINATGMATGGYTGEFEGDRIGILHQKELVLNQEDTKNILSAVTAVRSFTPDIFSQIEKVLDGTVIGTLTTLASSFMSAKVPDTTGIVEQDVKIEANFPNVTESSEIQDALMGLVNEAAQYARKRTE